MRIIGILLVCLHVSITAGTELAIDTNWNTTLQQYGLGQATGVAVDSHNHVFIFHRADRVWEDEMPIHPIAKNTIIMVDVNTGEKLAEWGNQLFIMPHGLSIDNEDNVWVTDVAGHTVQKFSHDGDLLMTLGNPGQSGSDAKHFNMPADIDFDSEGAIYIADGYINTRVMKFSAKGEYLNQWGEPGSEDGQLSLPHGISVDNNGRVFVADRANSRMQVFTTDGVLLKVINKEVVGRPYGIANDSEGSVWIIDGGDQPDETRANIIQLNERYDPILNMNTNHDNHATILGHDIAVSNDGHVFVVDAWANRVIKYRISHAKLN